MQPIILDTDIGTDFDDAAALALAMKSDGLNLMGVTTVYGDTALRARLAKKLLGLGGRQEIPVFAGCSQTLNGKRKVAWAGHEGEGVLGDGAETYDDGDAVAFMVRTVLKHPGEITLVAIGPLTNIAAALQREPRLAGTVKQIIIMGGYAQTGTIPEDADYYLKRHPYEHNIRSDPEAAAVVLNSGAPIVMTGLDVTYHVSVQLDDFLNRFRPDDPLHQALHALLIRWLAFRHKMKPLLQRDSTYMHDALAVSVLLDPTVVRTVPMRVSVEQGDHPKAGYMTAIHDSGGNVQVAVDVDRERFCRLFFDAVTG